MARRSGPATEHDDTLTTLLARRLTKSLLPGDPPVARATITEAARFVMSAALVRQTGQPALAIETDTSPGRRLTRIAAINDDMPFLVDSISAVVTSQGLAIDTLLHPVIPVERDAAGRLRSFPRTGDVRESIIYLETSRADARTRLSLAEALRSTLGDVGAAVADWRVMQAAMRADAERLDDAEGAELMCWFSNGRMTQLGHVVRRRDGRHERALGICRKSTRALLSAESYTRAFKWFEKGGPAPLVVKSNRASQVHRRVPLDVLIVPVVEQGAVRALSVHTGLWTSAAMATPSDQVPVLRARLAELMDKFGYDPRGHSGKALVHALTALPHDLLISFDTPDLERVTTAMMSAIDRPRPRLLLVPAPLERHLFAFVWLPRDAISTELRLQVMALLEASSRAKVLDWSLEVEGAVALLRFVIDIRDGHSAPDEAPLEAKLVSLVRGWAGAVETALARSLTPARAAALALRYAERFPLAYRSGFGPDEAATDILRLRRLGPGQAGVAPRRDARLYAGPEGGLRLKLYQKPRAAALSDSVPMLENFGFRVIGESTTVLDGGQHGAIQDFDLALAAGLDPPDLLARAGDIEAAIAAVLNGDAENDPFNRLIPAARLAVREANWLRAWFRYLRQTGMTFAVGTVVDALARAPDVTRGLIDLFAVRHDPDCGGNRAHAEAKAAERFRSGMVAVAAINDDRLLRAYRSVVDAVLRTNAFAVASGDALAFKLDPTLVPNLPRPVPWREMFVYSAQVEGVHLRAGPVARGGIRWSDRRDDFRTEVLGLMKAQRVKNAVIVPTGAKGGFYPKQLPDPTLDREGWLRGGRDAYCTFIRALLSVTDNLVGGRVVHPTGVVVRDGDDAYFVVAADKGTSTFSDTANAMAAEKGFWLGDAFASGGSKGYDHKAMGITARGAWLSVQRHFLELGVDVQSDTVRVAGCGDMSGDVFGNGMLLSKALKLVAAFDHRHIFLDPDPDPATSWAERQRLFKLPRSSWADYDAKLISRGGGVFPRSQKQIPVSREAQAMLGIESETLDPETLIAAILKSPVDLLWFGGIGTYVKAADESHAQVGDPANDGLRVDGGELRAKAIGEGANLAITQAGRIEFAQLGGRINTDFIDNSAGVASSDKEVNIKIALSPAQKAGRLSEPARIKLLASMTDEVSALVLEDNRLQALALSIAESTAQTGGPSYARLMGVLEDGGQLDRRGEGLPSAEEIARRGADGGGLTRPELAVLLSTAKLALQDGVEESSLPDDPGLEGDLLEAFPAPMRRRFRADILTHRLRREILATRIANRVVNRLGMLHPFELAEEEGATPAQVAAAFVAAERLLGLDDVWQAIERADAPESARLALFVRAADAARHHMADLLRSGAAASPPSQLAEELAGDVKELAKSVDGLLGPEAKAHSIQLRADLVGAAAGEREAGMVGRLFDLDGAIGLARLARDSGAPAVALARAFGELGAQLGLDWAQAAASRMAPSDVWERLLVAGLARDFQQMRLDFLKGVAGKRRDPQADVLRWAETERSAVAQLRAMVARAQAEASATPAMLAQLAGQARSLLTRPSK